MIQRNKTGFNWVLKQTLDSRGITRYALQKESGVSMTAIRALYEGESTRADLPTIEKVLRALRRLTGEDLALDSVLVWRP